MQFNPTMKKDENMYVCVASKGQNVDLKYSYQLWAGYIKLLNHLLITNQSC